MTATDQPGLTALTVALSIATMFALVLVCLDRRDMRRRKRAEKTCVTPPPVPARRRTPATRCPACHGPVAYENHPQGRDDALALHTAYECSERPVIRRNHR